MTLRLCCASAQVHCGNNWRSHHVRWSREQWSLCSRWSLPQSARAPESIGRIFKEETAGVVSVFVEAARLRIQMYGGPPFPQACIPSAEYASDGAPAAMMQHGGERSPQRNPECAEQHPSKRESDEKHVQNIPRGIIHSSAVGGAACGILSMDRRGDVTYGCRRIVQHRVSRVPRAHGIIDFVLIEKQRFIETTDCRKER